MKKGLDISVNLDSREAVLSWIKKNTVAWAVCI